MSFQDINPVDDIHDEVEHNEEFFVEHEEVLSLLTLDVFLQNVDCVERLSVILQKYQENSELLDPYLESIVQSLFSIIVPRVRLLGGLIIDYTQNIQNGRPIDNIDDLCGPHSTSALSILHRAFQAFYILCKVRRHKAVSKFLPHDVRDLEPTLLLLSSQSGYLYGGATGIVPVLPETWQTRYGLLLWLSVLVLIPFDLTTADSLHITQVSSSSVSVTAIDCTPLVPRVILLCQLYLADAGAVRDAAAVVLGKLFSRADMHHAHLASLCKWLRSVLQGVYSVSTQYQGQHIPLLSVGATDSRFGFIVAGSLYSLAEVIKGAPRTSARDLIVPVLWSTLVYVPRGEEKDALDTLLASTGLLWVNTDEDDGSITSSTAPEQPLNVPTSTPMWVTSPLCRKLWSKCLQRLALAFLQPLPPHSHWRYQRGLRSLSTTLAGQGSMGAGPDDKAADANTSTNVNTHTNIHTNASSDGSTRSTCATNTAAGVTTASADYWFVEEVLDRLLTLLEDAHTVVRWSAAKGIGRIVLQLPEREARAVVEAVLGLLGPHNKHNDCAVHGALLALAELLRRGLLAPHYLQLALSPVLHALRFDVRRGSHSVGAHVRDAACYVLWSVARAYDAEVLHESLTPISNALLTAAMYDREVNCRRAAAAAFQELIGRIGGVPHGIATLTLADYFTLSSRTDAYCRIACAVACLELEGCGEDYLYLQQYHIAGYRGDGWQSLARASKQTPNATPALLNPALASLRDEDLLVSLSRPRAVVFLDHLLSRCVAHWDAAVRSLAARAVVALASSHVAVAKHLYLTLLPPLLGLPVDAEVENTIEDAAKANAEEGGNERQGGMGSVAAKPATIEKVVKVVSLPRCCVFDVFARHGHLNLLSALLNMLANTSILSKASLTPLHILSWAPQRWRSMWPVLAALPHTLLAKNLLVGVHTSAVREALATYIGGLAGIIAIAEDALYTASLHNTEDATYTSLMSLCSAWHAHMPVTLAFLSSSLVHTEAPVQRAAATALSKVLTGAYRVAQRCGLNRVLGRVDSDTTPNMATEASIAASNSTATWWPMSLPAAHIRTALRNLLRDARCGSQDSQSLYAQYAPHLLTHIRHAAAAPGPGTTVKPCTTDCSATCTTTSTSFCATASTTTATSRLLPHLRLLHTASLVPVALTPAQLKQCAATTSTAASAAGGSAGAAVVQGVCRLLALLPASLLTMSLDDEDTGVLNTGASTSTSTSPTTTVFVHATHCLMPLTLASNTADPLARAFAVWTLGSMVRTLCTAVESGDAACLHALSPCLDFLGDFPHTVGYVGLLQLLNQNCVQDGVQTQANTSSSTGAAMTTHITTNASGAAASARPIPASGYSSFTQGNTSRLTTGGPARGARVGAKKAVVARKVNYFVPSSVHVGMELEGEEGDGDRTEALRSTLSCAHGLAKDMKIARALITTEQLLIHTVDLSLSRSRRTTTNPNPHSSFSLFAALLNTLLAALDDYQTDNRGDVGSWVRSCAMQSATLMLHSLERARESAVRELRVVDEFEVRDMHGGQGHSDAKDEANADQDRGEDAYLTENMSSIFSRSLSGLLARVPAAVPAAALLVLVRALAQQAGERIDRVRRCAIECLALLAAGHTVIGVGVHDVKVEATSANIIADAVFTDTNANGMPTGMTANAGLQVPHGIWVRKSLFDAVCVHLHSRGAEGGHGGADAVSKADSESNTSNNTKAGTETSSGAGVDAMQCIRVYRRMLRMAAEAVLGGQHVEHILCLSGDAADTAAYPQTQGQVQSAEGGGDIMGTGTTTTAAANAVTESADAVDWMDPTIAFPFVAFLACSPLYRYACVCGLAASAGGLTESTVRHAVDALWRIKETLEWLQTCVVANNDSDAYGGYDIGCDRGDYDDDVGVAEEEWATSIQIEAPALTEHTTLHYYSCTNEVVAHARITGVSPFGSTIEVYSLDSVDGVAEAMGKWYGLNNSMGLTGVTDLSFAYGSQETSAVYALHVATASTLSSVPRDATQRLVELPTVTEDATQRGLSLQIEAALPTAVRMPLYYHRPLDFTTHHTPVHTDMGIDMEMGEEHAAPSLFPLSPSAEVFWDLLIILHAQKGDPRIIPAVYTCWARAVTRGMGICCGGEEWYDIIPAAVRRVYAEIAKTSHMVKIMNAVQLLCSLLSVALTVCAPILGDNVFVVEGVDGLTVPTRHPAIEALNVLLMLITHKYPKVRRVAAQALHSVMLCANESEFGVTEDVLNSFIDILQNTYWDSDLDVSGKDMTNEIIRNRNSLYTLLGLRVPKDAYAFGQDKDKGAVKTSDVGTYAELVRELY